MSRIITLLSIMLLKALRCIVDIWLVFFFRSEQVEGTPPGTRLNEPVLFTPDWYANCGNPSSENYQLIEWGLQYQEEKNYAFAIGCFNKAIEKSPSEPLYRRLRGNCYWEMGDFENTITDFRIAVEFEPYNIDGRLNLSRVLFDARRYDEALEEVLILSDIDELVHLGNKLTNKREFNLAIQCYTLAIENDSNEAYYFRLRGECYQAAERYDLAVFDFYKTVILEPQDQRNRSLLKRALLVNGFSEGMEKILNVLDENERIMLGDEFFSAEKFVDATHCYTEAIENNLEESMYYEKRLSSYRSSGNTEGAISDLRKLIQINTSSNLKYKITLSEVLTEAEKYEDALHVLQMIDVKNMPEADITCLEEAYWKIREEKNKKRLDELDIYSKKLIHEEADRRISEIKTTLTENKTKREIEKEIRSLELFRDSYLQQFVKAVAKYKAREKPKKKRAMLTHSQRLTLLPRNFHKFFRTLHKRIFSYPQKLISGLRNRSDNTSVEVDKSDFFEEIPDYMLDPITYALIEDTVITPDGISYDRQSIRIHLSSHQYDPMTRSPLQERNLIRNEALKEAIILWKENQIH